jgi:hypothetical protein
MMELFIRLLHGDDRVPGELRAAHSFWLEFFADKVDWPEARWLEELNGVTGTIMQHRYELIFRVGDRYLAKTTLPYTCLGTLYDETDGFSDASTLAITVAKALICNSTLSLEVKSAAREAVKFFDLHSYDDELKTLVT